MSVTLGKGRMQQKPGWSHGLTAMKEKTFSNSKGKKNGDRAELHLLCLDLKIVSHWIFVNWSLFILVIAGGLRWSHIWKKIR